MSPSVLFVASTDSHIRNFHLPYLRWFQEQGWRVHVACGGSPTELPFAERTICLPFEKKMTAPENFRAASTLRRLMQEENYSFVSVHTSLAAFFTRFALLGSRKHTPLVNVVHGYLFDDRTPRLKREILLAAERLTASKTDLLLTMNHWDLDAAKRWRLGKRIDYIPGIGVDFSRLEKTGTEQRLTLRTEHGIAPDAFVLIYAAEFSKRKSQDVLIRAMQQLPRDVILVLAGDGALRAQCVELAETLGVADRVIFPGHVAMPLWYAMADAAVSSSRSEGLPFNIMEAMYAGLPVVASAVKGHVDLIREGETGLLYPYGDADACARQVARLIDTPALCSALREQAKNDVEQYRLDQVLPCVIAEYESLLPETAERTASLTGSRSSAL